MDVCLSLFFVADRCVCC
jgi:hypothetical protein